MKLILCKKCLDIVCLREKVERWCSCQQSGGIYTDDLYAEIWGECWPIGFANSTLVHALRDQPEEGMGKEFTAFVIPKSVETIKYVDAPGKALAEH